MRLIDIVFSTPKTTQRARDRKSLSGSVAAVRTVFLATARANGLRVSIFPESERNAERGAWRTLSGYLPPEQLYEFIRQALENWREITFKLGPTPECDYVDLLRFVALRDRISLYVRSDDDDDACVSVESRAGCP